MLTISSPTITTLFLLSLLHALTTTAHPARHAIEKRQSVPIVMGLASTYGAVAHTTLTSTGNTVITGSCGTSPGTAITGFPPGVCTVSTSAGGTAAFNAEAACLTAYNNAKGAVVTDALPSVELGGLTLPPGVYSFPASAASLSTTLTLNGASDPNGQWIFQITTTFKTAVGAGVILINGAQAGNVYFQVGTSATIAGATSLMGNVLAYTSVAVAGGASNNGTLCALNGAVTLIDNALTAVTNTNTTKESCVTLLGVRVCVLG
ncbi:MAG: hypothetical protein MMC33_009770 [Icmadophila ericetorum]|nr:hypothetical protein [Icmadophila ericetorum]